VRQDLTVLLLSSAVSLGGMAAVHAAPKAMGTPGAETKQAQRNQLPLAPGRAAGIKQAQGAASSSDWYLIGGTVVIGAGILLLVSGGGDEDTTATGTN
jgi:hypothetical protein